MTADNTNKTNVRYIVKGITHTIVSGFVLDENNTPTAQTIEFEGAFTRDRAEAKARKAIGSILITNVEQKRTRYQLDRAQAMEHATDERVNKDDIQLGETGTTVHYLRLSNEDYDTVPSTVSESITFDAPMTETRAFGAARRACAFDILPYAAEQNRNAKFLSRDVFFELAEPVENAADTDEADTDEADA